MFVSSFDQVIEMFLEFFVLILHGFLGFLQQILGPFGFLFESLLFFWGFLFQGLSQAVDESSEHQLKLIQLHLLLLSISLGRRILVIASLRNERIKFF